MRKTIAELVAILALDTKQFQAGMTQAQTASMKMSQNLTKIGKSMTMGLTLPIAVAGVAVTKMAMDFETQMANVFTLMDEATVKSRNWKKEVLDLSKKVPQSTDVLSKGLYDIVSAGIDAGKAMDVLKVSSESATAGLTTTAVAADAITSVLNAYNMSADEAADVSDVLFTTIRYGKTTFDELGPQIGKVVATAAAAGVSFEEVGAALATMTISGLKTDQAIVGLNQTILSFLKPTDEAIEAAAELGFDLSATTLATMGLDGAMTELSKKLGISVDDMIAMEQAGLDDAAMYDELAAKTGASAEQMAILFPNIRALKGALILAKDDGAKFNEMMAEQEDRVGATSKAFETMAETTAFEFDLALSSMKATAIEMGSHLLPIASDLFKKIGELADQFGELSDEEQQTILKTLGIVAAVGPLLWILGKTITTVITLKNATLALSAAMHGLLGPAAIAVGILIAHGAAIKKLSKNIENDYGQALVRGTSLITSITQATNTWQLSTKVAEEQNLSLFKVLFSKRSTITKLSEDYDDLVKLIDKYADRIPEVSRKLEDLTDEYDRGIISQESFAMGMEELVEEFRYLDEQFKTDKIDGWVEAQVRAKEAIGQYGEVYPELINLLYEYNAQLEAGIINEGQYSDAVKTIIDPLNEYTRLLELVNIGEERNVNVTAAQRERLKELGIELGIVDKKTEDVIVEEFNLQTTLDTLATTSVPGYAKALRDATGDVEEFTSALSEAYGGLFSIYLLNATMEGSLSAGQTAFENYTQAVKDHGIDSVVAKDAEKDWVDVLNAAAVTHIPGLITKVGELTAEEIIYLEGMQSLIDKSVLLGLGEEEVWKNMDADITQKINESILPNMDLWTFMAKKNLEAQEKEFSEYDKKLEGSVKETNALKEAIDKLSSKTIYIDTVFRTTGSEGYQHGGIVPGPIGVPRQATVHGGEIIYNPYDSSGSSALLAASIPATKNDPLTSSVINNTYNITTPEALTESEVKRQIDLLSREFGYRMGVGV